MKFELKVQQVREYTETYIVEAEDEDDAICQFMDRDVGEPTEVTVEREDFIDVWVVPQ